MFTSSNIWKKERASDLSKVLTLIDDQKYMQNFLRDILTEKEITEISSRLRAAQMLTNGSTYALIAQETRLSSRTIARISEWLQKGCGGYAIALSLTKGFKHTSPVDAD